MSLPKGPYRLVTVNTAPERAKKLIGRVVENLKERYTIQHIANCESTYKAVLYPTLSKSSLEIEEVRPTVESLRPDILVSTAESTAANPDQALS
jgi:hypothetical protein